MQFMTIAHVLIAGLAALSLLLFMVLLLRQRGWRVYSPRDKQINAHLNAQSMRILSSVVEQSRSGVIIADRHGVIEYVNPRYTQITGYSSLEATGRVAELIENEALTDANNLSLHEAMQLGAGWETFMVSVRKNGERFWQQVTASPILDELGTLCHIVLNIEDISERVETQAQMEKLAFYDPLTGLENRRLFKDRLEQALKRVRRSKKSMVLLFLDLDQFKRINDTLGHDAGDELLCIVAQRLRSCVREEDIVCRLGGDEFTILLADVAHADDASIVARKILQSLQDPIDLGAQEVTVSCSIGITIAPEDSMNASVLMRNADLAMYRAKDQGRNNFQYFTDDMNIESQARMSLENELRIALNNKDFIVYFQPQIDLDKQRICGFEALVRWRHEQFDLIPPDRFIPVAEETGLIVKLGELVLQQACSQLRTMQEDSPQRYTVAVNLSARQFRDKNLVSMVSRTLTETGLDPHFLELEITESMLMDDIEQAIGILTELKALGVAIAIDDFGTGHSSLSYLTRLPVDKLKVDRSFVSNLPESARHTAIATAIIAMAQRLRMKVVAEGVETQAQASFLEDHECFILQGFLYGRPVSAHDLPALMRELEPRIRQSVIAVH